MVAKYPGMLRAQPWVQGITLTQRQVIGTGDRSRIQTGKKKFPKNYVPSKIYFIHYVNVASHLCNIRVSLNKVDLTC